MPAYSPKTVGEPKIDSSIFDIYRILNWLKNKIEKTNKDVVAADHAAVTVTDTTTVDMSQTGQQISAATIGLTGTITFVE